MPDYWYIKNKTVIREDDSESEAMSKAYNHKIVVSRKPYFFQYIYPKEQQKFKNYVENCNGKCITRFSITLNELLEKENRTEAEQKFVDAYYMYSPLGLGDCTINRICKRIEREYDNHHYKINHKFDYSFMKYDGVKYDKAIFNQIAVVYKEYQNLLEGYSQFAKMNRIQDEDKHRGKQNIVEYFKSQCQKICPSEKVLCNIVLDLCYSRSNVSKQFAWDICGKVIIDNLLYRNNYIVSYPERNPNGDIEFNGMRFKMKTITLVDSINNIVSEGEEETDGDFE